MNWLITVLLIFVIPVACCANLIWFDGSEDVATEPPGKLLSDNDGYWGDCILTGVEYTCSPIPDNPGDIWREDASKFGRRLLDGKPVGNWWTSIGVNGSPLVVTFDFKRLCTFSEVDINTRNGKIAIVIETTNEESGPWTEVFQRSSDDCPDKQFHRLPLSSQATGRYLRLTVEASGISWLDEVLVWGDAEEDAGVPEAYKPIVETPIVTGVAFCSIPGIPKTSFADSQFWAWQRSLNELREQKAVWSRVSDWDAISDKPILPDETQRVQTLDIILAKNETEAFALALTSTSCEAPTDLKLTLSNFRPEGVTRQSASGLSGKIRIAGAIGSRYYGTNIGPLFEADNMLPSSLMRRYVTNAAGIENFPKITLNPAGSAVVWLSITSDDTPAGKYEARLTTAGGPVLAIKITVIDVTLPQTRVWLNTWSDVTGQFPFVDAERAEREMEYKCSLGASVWSGWPEDGTNSKRAQRYLKPYFDIWGVGDFGHKLYNSQIDAENISPEDEAKMAQMILDHVKKAQSLGLTYDDWYVQLTDEPGRKNSAAYGAIARIIRKTDPQVRIYCNPSFWEGNGCVGDDPVFDALSPWYNDVIDISVPIFLLLEDRPKSWDLFNHPRAVNAYYNVSTQGAKSERAPQLEYYRQQAWDAFKRGWNGWGFYSYFAPRGNPWNDFDQDWYGGEDLPDYSMVYPGPRGPVATRQSEAVRRGYEDYCLLTLLKELGKKAVLNQIIADYEAGVPMEQLRLRALQAASQ